MNLIGIFGRNNLTRAARSAKRAARRTARAAVAAACALVMLALPSTTRAQDKLCFNFAGPFTPDGVIANDAFWSGANHYVFVNGTPTPHASVRMKNSGSHIAIGIEVFNDPTFDDDDVIVLGFAPANGGAANHRRIHIFPVASGVGNQPAAPGGPPREVRYWTDSGAWNTGGGGTGAAPTWLQNASNNIRVTSSSPALMMKSYVVEIRIPITANPADPGINLSGDFGFYMNVIRVDTSTMSAVANEQDWPPSAPNIGDAAATVFLETNTPPPNTWGTGSLSGGCTGVSVIQSTDLFTNKVPDNEVKIGAADNVISARLTNTGTAAASGVRVTFRSSRFGIASPGIYNPIPAPNNPTAPSGNIGAMGGTAIVSTGNWDLTGPQPQFEPPANNLCVIAELTPTVAGTIITNDRAQRNMYFGHASEFTHSALLNAKGFDPPPPDTGGMQQFDLYVDSRAEILTRDPLRRSVVTQAGQRISQLTRVYHGYRLLSGHLIINKRSYRLREHAGSFGYVLRHEGRSDVKEWRQDLTGQGIERIRDGLYRVMLPPDGSVELTTRVESIEGGGTGTGGTGGTGGTEGTGGTGGGTGGGGIGVSRFSIGLRAGLTIPHGTFGDIFDPGFSFNGDVEYEVNDNFSAQAIFGYHRFRIFDDHLDSFQLSANGKIYAGSPGDDIRPFFNFGGGVYHFRPTQTNGGVNVGGGLQFRVTSHASIEAAYNFHNVFTPGFNARFSTVQGGVRFRF